MIKKTRGIIINIRSHLGASKMLYRFIDNHLINTLIFLPPYGGFNGDYARKITEIKQVINVEIDNVY